MTAMRFRQFFVALILMVALLGLAGVARGTNHTFTFISPTGSTIWQAGTTVTIQWTGGSPYPTVYLSLIDVPNWVVAQVITTSTPNTGSYEWTIPCTVPGGTYEVYIQDTSGPTEWKYSDDFTIVGCKDPADPTDPTDPVDPTDPKEQPDLAIEKKPDGELVAGQNAAYQIVVSNVGTATAPGPIVVTDSVGAGLTFLSAAGSGWTCTPSVGPIPGPTAVTCTHPGPLPAGGSLPPIALTMQVATDAKEVRNCARVAAESDTGAVTDENPDNNSACVTSPVDPGGEKPGQICGIKFLDHDGDGVQDPGEPGLLGWTIQVKDAAGNVVATTTSGPKGRWCVKVKPGAYTVFEMTQPGWVQTAPQPAPPGTATVTVAVGQTAIVIFGNRPEAKPCCLTFTLQGGKADNFSTADGATAEPATPPPSKPQAYFDQTAADKRFDHRFDLPAGNCIREARLEILVRPLHKMPVGVSSSRNDTMAIYAGSSAWGAKFGPSGPGSVTNQLSNSEWVLDNWPGGMSLGFDLANLPGGTNLLPALQSARVLDIAVQDDTSVDHARLTVRFCECTEKEAVALEVGRAPAEEIILTVGDGAMATPGEWDTVADPRKVMVVDGAPREIDAAPIIRGGRTFLPVRALAEAFGLDVVWDPAQRMVTFSNDEQVIDLWVGQSQARVMKIDGGMPNRISADVTVPNQDGSPPAGIIIMPCGNPPQPCECRQLAGKIFCYLPDGSGVVRMDLVSGGGGGSTGNPQTIPVQRIAIDPANSDVVPFIENGRVMLPVRFISEVLGLDVDFNAATGEVRLKAKHDTEMNAIRNFK